MRKQVYGVTSLGLMAAAVLIAAVVMFKTSWVLGVVYLAICVAGSGAILFAYCAKCPCKAHCAHIFPGKAAMAFDRQPGPYTAAELAAPVVTLLLLLGLPQFWLWRNMGLFITFWVLSAIAFFQIRTVVCRACDNSHCPLKI